MDQDIMEELITRLWVISAIRRITEQGLLEQAAPADDPVAELSQRLLVEAGFLAENPIGLSERVRTEIPTGVPPAAIADYAREQLKVAARYAAGAAPGWAETDPALIRWRGSASGPMALAMFDRGLADVPGFPDRLTERGATFLDVGTGAGGIALAMCRRYPGLSAVGLDVHEPAISVARTEVAAAGLDEKIEIRAQSVAEITDTDAFDLMWVPQPFIPSDALEEALPRLFRAGRRGAALVMVVASNPYAGVGKAATDLRNLMMGGGTLQPPAAITLLEKAGFTDVRTFTDRIGATLTAVRP